MKFEYRYIEFGNEYSEIDEIVKELNKLGKKGWQLVSKIESLAVSHGAMFMRQIKD